MDKFEGITTYHDGLAVSDYVNMIPLGETCIDRIGETLISEAVETDQEIRGWFVDSTKRLYVAVADTIHTYSFDNGGYNYEGPLKGVVGGVLQQSFALLNHNDKVTFTESSIKPSTVYCCDGKYIYKWSTGLYDNISVKMMLSPKVVPSTGYETNARIADQYSAIIGGQDANVLDIREIASIESIDWFDNKLVAVEKSKNTVWLTCTDPEQFTRNTSLDPWGGNGESYELWNNWYASTNSADKLNTAKAFNGQLYLLNSNSIEIWSRTGNESAPLQSNTMQVIHHGARAPLVMGDFMYVIANDTVGQEYIGLIQGGSFKRISTLEIDNRLKNPKDIVPLSIRGETHIMVRTDSGLDGFVFSEGRWWRWVHPAEDSDGVIASIISDFAITQKGRIVEFNDNTRRTYLGTEIQRYIRDSFDTWHERKLFRKIAISLDSGRVTDHSTDEELRRQIYIRLSTNRGLSFGKYYYRTLGKSGVNNKAVEWLGLGSGNSMLLEIGTSSAYKLQIYDIKIVVQ